MVESNYCYGEKSKREKWQQKSERVNECEMTPRVRAIVADKA